MSCGCIYTGVDEFSEVISEKIVTARKPHACMECGKTIEPGDMYELFVGKDDDSAFTHKTCTDCTSTRKEFFCAGYFFGRIWHDITDHIYDTDGEISSDCLLRLTPRAREMVCDLIDEYWQREGES